jgi:DNA-directed RNA polymerase subunit L
MDIEMLEKTKESIKFKILHERHTISQMLKNELLENKDVSMASYILEHPEADDGIFYVKMKSGKDVLKAVEKAIDNLISQISDFKDKSLAAFPKEKTNKVEKKKVTKKK